MFLDDLPFWGLFGRHEVEQNSTALYTHIHFDISYNEDRVIGVNISTDPQSAIELEQDTKRIEMEYTYSVKWTETTIPFERRLEKYSKESLLPQNLEVRRYAFAFPSKRLF